MNKYQEALDKLSTMGDKDLYNERHLEWIKTLQELINQTKVSTLEEVKQEWEAKGYIWIETEIDIKLICKIPTTYLKIRLFKNSKSYQGIINLEEHQLITKTMRALGWI